MTQFRLSDFDYNLPKELIAQYPSEKRDEARLLVLDRDRGRIEHRVFKDIVEFFNKGDLIVLNDTKVMPFRLTGRKETGGKVEALILHGDERCRVQGEYDALLKPLRGCRIGARLIFGDGELKAEVTGIENGKRVLKFNHNISLEEALDKWGKMPLPPYIKRKVEEKDRERYQTIYASKKGAVAAPTAGLHFTKDILSRFSSKGVGIEYVTLHVGYGTFRPVRSIDIRKHRIEKEYFEVEDRVMEKLKGRKHKTIAVGTTTCRVLETIASNMDRLLGDGALFEQNRAPSPNNLKGWTDLFIYPSYRFKMVDALLTNFHLPRTTLFMLVSAFCGKDLLLKAYQEAIKKKYRVYSYGDAMLIL